MKGIFIIFSLMIMAGGYLLFQTRQRSQHEIFKMPNIEQKDLLDLNEYFLIPESKGEFSKLADEVTEKYENLIIKCNDAPFGYVCKHPEDDSKFNYIFFLYSKRTSDIIEFETSRNFTDFSVNLRIFVARDDEKAKMGLNQLILGASGTFYDDEVNKTFTGKMYGDLLVRIGERDSKGFYMLYKNYYLCLSLSSYTTDYREVEDWLVDYFAELIIKKIDKCIENLQREGYIFEIKYNEENVITNWKLNSRPNRELLKEKKNEVKEKFKDLSFGPEDTPKGYLFIITTKDPVEIEFKYSNRLSDIIEFEHIITFQKPSSRALDEDTIKRIQSKPIPEERDFNKLIYYSRIIARYRICKDSQSAKLYLNEILEKKASLKKDYHKEIQNKTFTGKMYGEFLLSTKIAIDALSIIIQYKNFIVSLWYDCLEPPNYIAEEYIIDHFAELIIKKIDKCIENLQKEGYVFEIKYND